MADRTPPPARTRKRRTDSIRVEAEFRAAVERLGGTVIAYAGARDPAHVVCAAGHESHPAPYYVVKRGGGICRTCAGQDPTRSAESFQAEVERQGGILKGRYTRATEPVLIECSAGHERRVWPTYIVLKGGKICAICSGRTAGVSEGRYREAVAKQGGIVMEEFQGVHTPTLVRCPEGHENRVTPNHILRGVGICSTCTGNAKGIGKSRFRQRVEEQGGTVLGDFINSSTRVRVRCQAGHVTDVRPQNVLSGQGMCRVCAGKDPQEAERAFRARVAALGGTVLEPVWKGVGEPHRIRCSEGHLVAPLPTHVQQGTGVCRFCAGREWDCLYVVRDLDSDLVKFGITSGDPKHRLGFHARRGFADVVRLHTGLPGDTAPELERTIIAALRDAGEEPARGREYYSVRVMPVVLDLVDNHPVIRPPEARGLPRRRVREQLGLW